MKFYVKVMEKEDKAKTTNICNRPSPFKFNFDYRNNLCVLHFYFFAGWYEDNWFEQNLKSENISCTIHEMRRAAEGHLTTEALMWNQNNQKTISGMSSEDFRLVRDFFPPMHCMYYIAIVVDGCNYYLLHTFILSSQQFHSMLPHYPT